MDPPLGAWIESTDDLVVIEYHTGFPYPLDPFYDFNPDEINARRAHYGIGSVPAVRFDGPQAPAGNNPTAYGAKHAERRAVPSRATIGVEVAYDAGFRSGTITVEVTPEQALAGDWRVRIALTESEIFFDAPNGIDWHHHVFRRFVGGVEGTSISLGTGRAADPITLPFSVDAELAEANVSFVVVLQNEAGYEVEQAAVFDLVDASTPITAIAWGGLKALFR